MFMLVFLMLGLNICYLRNGGCIFGEEWLCKDEEKEEKIPKTPPPGVTGGRRWSTATQSVAGQSMASHQSLHTNEHGWMGGWMEKDSDDDDDDNDYDNDDGDEDDDDDIILFRDEKDQLCPPRAEPGDA